MKFIIKKKKERERVGKAFQENGTQGMHKSYHE